MIYYSRGKTYTDNKPNQCEAKNFAKFAKAVLSDRSQKKGQTYICAPMNIGLNDNQEKYQGEKTWRSKNLAAPRNFLPFDFDGFDSPETFSQACEWLKRYQGFGYTTASHTVDKPRCRAVLAQSRPTTRDEGIALGQAIQRMMERDIGAGKIKFDDSVYRAEQPLFTPLKNAEMFEFGGNLVDVDMVLNASHLKNEAENKKESYSGGNESRFLEGSRNSTLASVAGNLRRQGEDAETINAALQALNDSCCRPPMPAEEVKRIAESISRYQPPPPHVTITARTAFRLTPIADLLKKPTPHDWLLRDYLERNTLNLLFGDPVVGKSLLAIAWAVCVATGRDWNGCATKQGSVIYLAGEGHSGLSRRLKALEITYGQALDNAPIFVSNAAISLIDDYGVQKIIEAAETMIAMHGIPALLIVDTLARHFSGGDENAAPDMTRFIDAVDALRQKYGCAVLVVHHSGHGNKERARAHSVLPAAVDSIFCLTDKNGIRSLRCDKAKDFEPPADRAFTLRSVTLPWLDDDGLSFLTAPVLEATAALPTAKALPPSAQKALHALCEAIEKAGIKAPAACIAEAGSEFAIQGGKVVMIEDWKNRYLQVCGKDSKDAARKSFGRARDVLLEEEKIKTFDSWVWLP